MDTPEEQKDATMKHRNLSMDDERFEWAKAYAKRKGYTGISDLLRRLLDKERERDERQKESG